MTKEDIKESIKKALRYEFEKAEKDRAIEIYHTSRKSGFKDQADEMQSDIEFEFEVIIK